NCVADLRNTTNDPKSDCFYSADGLDDAQAIAVAPSGALPIIVASGTPGSTASIACDAVYQSSGYIYTTTHCPGTWSGGADALVLMNRSAGPTDCQLNSDLPQCQPTPPCDPSMDPACMPFPCDPTIDPTCGAGAISPKCKKRKNRSAHSARKKK